jgi:hypothetical protein
MWIVKHLSFGIGVVTITIFTVNALGVEIGSVAPGGINYSHLLATCLVAMLVSMIRDENLPP